MEVFKAFLFLKNVCSFVYLYPPLNVITLDKTASENIKRMITITDCFYLVSSNKWVYEI